MPATDKMKQISLVLVRNYYTTANHLLRNLIYKNRIEKFAASKVDEDRNLVSPEVHFNDYQCYCRSSDWATRRTNITIKLLSMSTNAWRSLVLLECLSWASEMMMRSEFHIVYIL